jgi:hypothetical protein
MKELYNLRHSSLRNAIERIYGVVKKRFPIIVTMRSFDFSFQCDLVLCAMMVHNFIRFTQVYEDELYNENDVPDVPDDDNVPEVEMGGNARDLLWRAKSNPHEFFVLPYFCSRVFLCPPFFRVPRFFVSPVFLCPPFVRLYVCTPHHAHPELKTFLPYLHRKKTYRKFGIGFHDAVPTSYSKLHSPHA